MERRDGRLDGVRPRRRAREGPRQEREAFGDRRLVPSAPVLVLQEDEIARGVHPGVAACVRQEHEGEEAARFALAGKELDEEAREPDRLTGEVAAHERLARGRRVALVEDEVERREDALEAPGELGARGHPVRDACAPDLPLGADEALGQRAFRNEKRARDLRRREAPERVQCERDARVQRQRRVRAREDEPEAVVGEFFEQAVRGGRVHGLLLAQEGRLAREDPLAAQAVERLVARGPDDPCAGTRRDALGRPALRGDHERLLHGLLGAIEVPDEPDEARENASGLIAEEAVEVHGRT